MGDMVAQGDIMVGGGKKKLLAPVLPNILPAHFEDYMGTDRFTIAHLRGVKAPSISEVRLLLPKHSEDGWGSRRFSGWLERHLITSSQNKTNQQTRTVNVNAVITIKNSNQINQLQAQNDSKCLKCLC